MKAIEPRDTAQREAGEPRHPASVPPVRREYVSPRLMVYGALAELTGSQGNDDLDPLFAGSTITS
jgi:hypothetical protein